MTVNGVQCLAQITVRNGEKNCENGDDERENNVVSVEEHIDFYRICDGIKELRPIFIDAQNETDETECEPWPCNNTYTRCDGFWSCNNGADEVNCPPSMCPDLEHNCVFLTAPFTVSCLPIARAGDGIIDCLGGSDERNRFLVHHSVFVESLFHCSNASVVDSAVLCTNYSQCPFDDDEIFCQTYPNMAIFSLCHVANWIHLTEVEKFVCNFVAHTRLPRMIYFTIPNMRTYPLEIMTNRASPTTTQTKIRTVQNNQISTINEINLWQCHRGIPIYMRMKSAMSKLVCLCPPSYYGRTCQYQNQRVSLTFQMRMTSDWRSVFTFIITLIDDENKIESYDLIDYLSIRDCDTKFNLHLLYSSRPKNLSMNYSIHIDAFNKLTLQYRASWIFPLRFSFLPVHRLSVLLIVPNRNVDFMPKCTLPCVHGQCLNYVNDPKSTFCRCESGWTGVHCNSSYKCECATHSICIANSVCLCRIDRIGRRCLLYPSSCHSKSCFNGGQCVPIDERLTSAHLNEATCICPEEYFGEQCEHRHNRIDISFHKSLQIPSSLIIHLITVHNQTEHSRTSLMKKISYDQDVLTLYHSVQFNLAFAQISDDDYYLIILSERQIISMNISTEIRPTHQCLSIHELFNKTIANQHLLKRIKFYHIPCHTSATLVCFYDSTHLCLCDLTRNANCFEFDHHMTYNCGGYNLCENDGQCFQDNFRCPTTSICVCQECYYGSRCQFSTKGSTLSLDTILGYHISRQTNMSQQPMIIQIALVFTIIMLVLGSISNSLALLTFTAKKTHDVGCGLYLLGSSITYIILICIFTVKLSVLLASQMDVIGNRAFVQIQCILLDFLVRVLLNSGDWLSACVATERAVNIFKGINFDKEKSKQVAKWMIPIVLLVTIGTHIHDPLNRHLIDDEDEQRTWCVTTYSSSLQIFDWTLNIIQFSIPFTINCISALLIILVATRHRATVQRTQSYRELLSKQFQHHKHLLISPCILVLLALPRLIISFLFGCMKSARDPWIYLIGYFISFIPSMSTFVIFVLPSKAYKKEFQQKISRFRRSFFV